MAPKSATSTGHDLDNFTVPEKILLAGDELVRTTGQPSFTAEALIAPSLTTELHLDTLRTNDPCIEIEIADSSTAINLLPYGCEVSTIGWTSAPHLAIRQVGLNGVLLEVDGRGLHTSLQVFDILGREVSAYSLPPSIGTSTLWISTSGSWYHIVTATTNAGSSFVRFLPEVE
mgnify:CR=1 FL=1